MLRVCCVTGCNNIWNPTCDISYFGFPLKNENLLEKWKQVIPTTYKITKYTTICSDLFSNASYTYKSGKRFFNKNAVPTIFHLAGDESSGEKSRTFVFHDEGHTLGNVLRSIIAQYPDVNFCGYTVPHPAETKMHFRIQAKSGRAVDILRRGLEDLEKVCDHTSATFASSYEKFKKSPDYKETD